MAHARPISCTRSSASTARRSRTGACPWTSRANSSTASLMPLGERLDAVAILRSRQSGQDSLEPRSTEPLKRMARQFLSTTRVAGEYPGGWKVGNCETDAAAIHGGPGLACKTALPPGSEVGRRQWTFKARAGALSPSWVLAQRPHER